MGYKKRATSQYKVPRANIRKASQYLTRKGVRSAYIFGSGLRVADPRHDLDIAVDLPPTDRNKKKFEDGTSYGIDLFLLDELNFLYSVALDDFLYTDSGDLQDLESVGAQKIDVIPEGYRSHGYWSTLGEIRAIEHERGNPFPRLRYPNDTPAIWLCPTRRKALRYLVLAEDWERVSDESQPLTEEEEEMLEDIVEVKLKPTDRIVHEDPDEGFLVIRPR